MLVRYSFHALSRPLSERTPAIIVFDKNFYPVMQLLFFNIGIGSSLHAQVDQCIRANTVIAAVGFNELSCHRADALHRMSL